MSLDFVGMGMEVAILIIGFAVGWGKLTGRLDDHIETVREWQLEMREWQKQHVVDAKERSALVTSISGLLERQKLMNEYVKENLDRVNGKLWP